MLLPRLALLLAAVFSTLIAAVRLQPLEYIDPDVLFTSAGCPPPCFMGIRPGQTSLTEAISILNSSDWVREISQPRNRERGTFSWQWSGQQPDWINTSLPGVLTVENREVAAITVSTHVQLGALRLALDTPDYGELLCFRRFGAHNLRYVDQAMLYRSFYFRPFDFRAYWESPVQIDWLSRSYLSALPPLTDHTLAAILRGCP